MEVLLVEFLGFAKEKASVPVYGLTIDKSLEEQLKAEIPKVDIPPYRLSSGFRN